MYRNHFYIEKLLGNLVGLGRLVARESNANIGALTVVSTHAEIDRPGSARRADIEAMVVLAIAPPRQLASAQKVE
jgi:hypothetical protein